MSPRKTFTLFTRLIYFPYRDWISSAQGKLPLDAEQPSGTTQKDSLETVVGRC